MGGKEGASGVRGCQMLCHGCSRRPQGHWRMGSFCGRDGSRRRLEPPSSSVGRRKGRTLKGRRLG